MLLSRFKFNRILSLFFPYLLARILTYNTADILFDAGGFQFSDQFATYGNRVRFIDAYYSRLKKRKTVIIFLPQAFGPFEKLNSKKIIEKVHKYCDLLIARDKQSLQHITSTIGVSSKVVLYPDFTSLVNQKKDLKSEMDKNIVYIIPNDQMINKGIVSLSEYVSYMSKLIQHITCRQLSVALMTHTSSTVDYNLCRQINTKLISEIPIITGLNALEIKELISKAYLVISSRFHGVANALNNCIPCLATSWSHKYRQLYQDYEIENSILDIKSIDESIERLDYYLDRHNNCRISDLLNLSVAKNQAKTLEMWNKVWDIV